MKKKLINLSILIIIAALQTSCATKQIPANPCEIKLQEKISMFNRDIKFKGDSVRYTESMTNCTFLFWGCRYTETSIDDDNNIYVEGSGLFNARSRVGVLKGNKVVFDATFLDSFAKVSDLEVSLKDKMVYRKTDSNLIGAIVGKKNASHRDGVSINNSCTLKESAIGAITIFNAKNAQL